MEDVQLRGSQFVCLGRRISFLCKMLSLSFSVFIVMCLSSTDPDISAPVLSTPVLLTPVVVSATVVSATVVSVTVGSASIGLEFAVLTPTPFNIM